MATNPNCHPKAARPFWSQPQAFEGSNRCASGRKSGRTAIRAGTAAREWPTLAPSCLAAFDQTLRFRRLVGIPENHRLFGPSRIALSTLYALAR